MSNEVFLEKAPAEVIQRERERLERLRRDMEAVTESLEALG